MVDLTQAQYGRVAQAVAGNTGVVIPAPNTAALELITGTVAKKAEEYAGQLAAAKGAEDQMKSPDLENPAQVAGGAIGRMLPISGDYQKSADAVFAAAKSNELRDKTASLLTQYATDPEGFNKAFAETRRSWLEKGVRPDLVAPFAQIADQQQTRGSMQINANVVQRDMETKAAEILKVFDANRSAVNDGIGTGKMSADEATNRMAETVTAIDAGVKGGFISPIQGKKLQDEFAFTIKSAELTKQFKSNPSPQFIEGVRSGSINVGSTPFLPEQRELLANRLTTMRNQMLHEANVGAAQQAAKIKTMADDDLVSRATTGVGVLTEDQVKAMFPKNPAAATEFMGKQKLATDGFNFRGSIGLSSAAEDTAALEKLKPAPGSVGYADAYKAYSQAQSIVAQKWQQVQQDPFQYVVTQSPAIRDMITSEDPAIRAQGYQTGIEIQTRLGVSPGAQSVLPKAQAQALVADIHTLAETSPQQAADKVAALANQYGPMYPMVARQLARLESPLSPTYQVVSTLTGKEDTATRVDLVKALSMGDKALRDNLDQKNTTLRSSIDQEVQSKLSDFNRTVTAQGDPRLIKTMNDAATSLAYYYAAQPGRSASDAAKSAVTALTNRYDFIGTMRVPKGTGAAVEGATAEAIKSITPSALAPVPARPGETLTEEQRLGIQMDQAKRGYWVTNEDGTGVVRMYPNGQPVMVKREALPDPSLPTSQGSASTIDPSVENRALAKKRPLGPGNAANEVRTDVAQETVANRQQQAPYRRFEVLFRDVPALTLKQEINKSPPLGQQIPGTGFGGQ